MTADAFEAKTFDAPDDRMAFPKGHAEVVNTGGRRLLRVTFEPGFHWSDDMAPAAKTERCQLRHVFWVMSGRLGLGLADGTEVEVGPGDLVSLAPDHDSWTVGEESVVFLDMDPKPPGS